MPDLRWTLPLDGTRVEASCDWFQDEKGRFHAVEFASARYAATARDGDLELFQPKWCYRCKDQAGWLPPAFTYCPACGAELERCYQSGGDHLAGGWPRRAIEPLCIPGGEPESWVLPPGGQFSLIRVPEGDRLFALDADSGKLWAWSRPSAAWRPVGAPTGHPGVPADRFAVYADGDLMLYPTTAGAVLVRTGYQGPLHWEVSDWKPRGSAARIGRKLVMPAETASDELGLATRDIDGVEWTIMPLSDGRRAENAGPPPLEPDPWFGIPIVEEDQVHWPGQEGVIYCDDQMTAGLRAWPKNFQVLLGTPPLETADGRLWAQGTAETDDGAHHWAFSRVSFRAATQTEIVQGVFFVSGRECFRGDERFKRAPWDTETLLNDRFSIGDNEFLVPLCSIGGRTDGLSLLAKVEDRALMAQLLTASLDAPVRGDLFIGDTHGAARSLEASVYLDGKRWPQVIDWNSDTLVYDPVRQTVWRWQS